MINTYNETHLHRTLKNLYSQEDAVQEMALEGFVCDIYTPDGRIIEIQTAHIAALKQKIHALLPKHPITIVYPIIKNAYIRMLNADGSVRSYRKSPKHGHFFQLFKELYALIPYLDHRNFNITVLFIDCEIIKIDDKKGRSRYKHPRIIDKKLLQIHKTETIQSIDDLCAPVLKNLPNLFTSQEVRRLSPARYASYAISFLKKAQKITYCTKAGRYHVYKKTGAE